MTLEIFEKILERINKYQFRVIVLYHGGEPLLNKNFFYMASKLKPLAGRFMKTVTNGAFMVRDVIQKILDSPLDSIEISLDGLSPEENDQIRIGSNFHKIAANVIELVNLKIKLGLKKPSIFIGNTQVPITDEETNRFLETPEYLKKAFEKLGNQIQFKLAWSMMWPGMPKKDGNPPDNNICDHINNTITIRWNGDVVPCCYDLTSQMVMGNILQEEPEQIWNNQRYQKLRQDITEWRPPELCRNCPVVFSQKVMTADYLYNL